MMKYAIITGGYSGIGESISIRLISLGYKLAIVGKTKTYFEDFVHKNSLDNKVSFYYCDFNSDQSIDDAIQNIKNDYPYINLLINNYGYFSFQELYELNYNELINSFNVNTFSPLLISIKLNEMMRYINDSQIINISSEMSQSKGINNFAYRSSKSSLNYMMELLTPKFLEDGIRINTISPGCVNTRLLKTIESFYKQEALTPLKRKVEVGEIADAVEFLINNKSIVGQNIIIDGGISKWNK